jgi:arginyl-tRNA synthetase
VIRDALASALRAALTEAGIEPPPEIHLERPGRPEHGDWSSNVAMATAKANGRVPRELAGELVDRLNAAPPAHVERVEIAGPGFVNFHLRETWLHDVLTDVLAGGEQGYARLDLGGGKRVNVEFVSATPTGPVHAGGGRWAAFGDSLCRILERTGHDVHREYYLNDAGNQLDTFGASLFARYEGREPPEDGYQGAYLEEMAERLRAEIGDQVTEEQAREWGYRDVVRQLEDDVARIGVHFDTWFSERTLHERGEVEKVLADLKTRGVTFEDDGATWLRTSDFGDQRDRVLIKSDGSTTYLCNDLAYHRDKLARGWEHLIDIWGADHHGQVKSLQAGLEALGEPAGQPEVLLGQLVKVQKDGQVVRMSKRTGNIVTLADILDDVDPDVARLTFLLQGIYSAQTFYLEVLTAKSSENTLY